MINSSYYRPRIFPIKGTGDDAEIDRAQNIDPTVGLNREKVEEVGRDGVVGYLKKSPTIGYRLTQYEYGNIEFWQKLVNNESIGGVSDDDGITLNDFKSPYFDLCAYLTEDDGTFKGTIYYPSLRTSGFSLSIGDPQAVIERSFDFVGESAQILQGDNKYLVYQKHTAGSASDDEITLDATAIENPNVAGTYMLRVTHYDASLGTTVELEIGASGYTETSGVVTITKTIDTSDVIKLWYTATTLPTGYNMFTNNDTDVAALIGDSVDIYLYIPSSAHPAAGDYIYRLQSVTLDVTFDREDLGEIGNKKVVQRGVRNSTVSVTLGRILENFTVEEILAGQSADYGIIDVENLTDSAALIIKIYDDNDKGTFKYGFKATGLSAMDLGTPAGVNEHVKKDATLEGEDLTISANSSVIGI